MYKIQTQRKITFGPSLLGRRGTAENPTNRTICRNKELRHNYAMYGHKKAPRTGREAVDGVNSRLYGGAVQGVGQLGEDVNTDVILSVLNPGDMTLPDGTAFGCLMSSIMMGDESFYEFERFRRIGAAAPYEIHLKPHQEVGPVFSLQGLQ